MLVCMGILLVTTKRTVQYWQQLCFSSEFCSCSVWRSCVVTSFLSVDDWTSSKYCSLFFILSCKHMSRQGEGGHAPQNNFSMSCHFVLWKAVSRTKYCCSLKVEVFAPKKFGLATLLLVTTLIQMACISLASSHVPILNIKHFTKHFRTFCSIFHWQKARKIAKQCRKSINAVLSFLYCVANNIIVLLLNW